jgi:hypothetical protein
MKILAIHENRGDICSAKRSRNFDAGEAGSDDNDVRVGDRNSRSDGHVLDAAPCRQRRTGQLPMIRALHAYRVLGDPLFRLGGAGTIRSSLESRL